MYIRSVCRAVLYILENTGKITNVLHTVKLINELPYFHSAEYCIGAEQLKIRKGHCTVICAEMPIVLKVRQW